VIGGGWWQSHLQAVNTTTGEVMQLALSKNGTGALDGISALMPFTSVNTVYLNIPVQSAKTVSDLPLPSIPNISSGNVGDAKELAFLKTNKDGTTSYVSSTSTNNRQVMVGCVSDMLVGQSSGKLQITVTVKDARGSPHCDDFVKIFMTNEDKSAVLLNCLVMPNMEIVMLKGAEETVTLVSRTRGPFSTTYVINVLPLAFGALVAPLTVDVGLSIAVLESKGAEVLSHGGMYPEVAVKESLADSVVTQIVVPDYMAISRIANKPLVTDVMPDFEATAENGFERIAIGARFNNDIAHEFFGSADYKDSELGGKSGSHMMTKVMTDGNGWYVQTLGVDKTPMFAADDLTPAWAPGTDSLALYLPSNPNDTTAGFFQQFIWWTNHNVTNPYPATALNGNIDGWEGDAADGVAGDYNHWKVTDTFYGHFQEVWPGAECHTKRTNIKNADDVVVETQVKYHIYLPFLDAQKNPVTAPSVGGVSRGTIQFIDGARDAEGELLLGPMGYWGNISTGGTNSWDGPVNYGYFRFE
jgi:hypothetical protein